MTSPLLPYANSRLLVQSKGEVTASANGRLQEADGQAYFVVAFMKRAEYNGVSSGSKPLPLTSQLDGEMMPGGSGDQFYYRGYALQYALAPSGVSLAGIDESTLTMLQVTGQATWLEPGTVCEFAFGDDPIVEYARVQRSSGVFGGQGIDQIVYEQLGGVQLQITSGEVLN